MTSGTEQLSVPLNEPSRHNGPSRLPGGWRSTGTTGGSIAVQDSAGARLVNEHPNRQLWMPAGSTGIKPMPMQKADTARQAGRRCGHGA
jgi:hypothetical protein